MADFISFEEVSADLASPIIDGNGARDYYRLGYYRCASEAASALQKLKGENRSAMPILFLYRQYVESALKDALHLSNAFDLEQVDKKFGHDLAGLWKEAKRVLGNFVDKDFLESIDAPIAEFDKVDRRADAFRYAVDRDGQRHFPKQGSVILHELMKQMEEVETVLELAISEIRVAERQLDADIAEAVAKDRF
ncbi:hypothetical protein [Pseudolabrys sp. FHR47]|uniref:hypothetical protein n=1 Tax=Pseudolabrys sp. FHR47 TaxID=2562284 RepID=UPI0010BE714F|nr:hypothetical protein [Pseudolabrys sp. FHR47]